jgi:NitT/TauT family transport system substrate-binding protein
MPGSWVKLGTAMRGAAVLVGAAVIGIGLSNSALAEGKIRIAEQFGISYLPLQMMRHHKLIEARGKEAGLDISVEWARFSSGASMNDALLSDSIDLGSGGVGPLLTIWDRTKGSLNVKAIAAINSMPLILTTINPNVKTLRDFSEKDKIALPAIKVSVQARTLQMAAEQAFGEGKHEALDRFTVSMPHPDATAALLSGASEINASLSSPPFQYQQLDNPKVRKVFSSYEVLGGPHTFNLVWAKQAFRDKNPKTYAAFLAALRDAVSMIDKDKSQAAEAYLAVNKSDMDRAFLERILADPEIRFTIVPQNTMKYAEFMSKVGAIKSKPASWKDYLFEDLHAEPGS